MKGVKIYFGFESPLHNMQMVSVFNKENVSRLDIKGKIFQLRLTDEIQADKSSAKRSQLTGGFSFKIRICSIL